MPFKTLFLATEFGTSPVVTVRQALNHDADAWDATWKRLLRRKRRPTADAFWDWRTEIQRAETQEGFLCVAAVTDRLEGLLSLSIAQSRLEPACTLVYVEYLGAAPWNQRGLTRKQKLQGIGSLLLQTAANVSLDLGFEGRIGLHSKPEAEGFYRDRFLLIDRGAEMTSDGRWVYFEATPEVARKTLL